MKKVILAGTFAVLGMIAISSCKKNYDCVLADGTVVSTCTDCKSSGLIKTSFDSSCALSGGTVQAQ